MTELVNEGFAFSQQCHTILELLPGSLKVLAVPILVVNSTSLLFKF